MTGSVLAGCGFPYVTCAGAEVASHVARDAAGAVISVLATSMSSAAVWMLDQVVALLARPPRADLTTPWFSNREARVLPAAACIVTILALAGTIGPVLRQDLRRLGRVWGVGVPVAAVSGYLAVKLVAVALRLVDVVSTAVGGPLASGRDGALGPLAKASILPGAPAIVTGFVSALIMAAALLIWMELTLRTCAVYVAVFFAPLALGCYVWPATTAVAKRVIELLSALIVSKLVIVATLSLAVEAIRSNDSLGGAVVGAGMLLMAVFAPFCLFRLAPIVETAAIAHLSGMSRRPISVAARGATTAARLPAHPLVMMMAGRSQSGDGAPLDSVPVAPQRLNERAADYVHGGQPGD